MFVPAQIHNSVLLTTPIFTNTIIRKKKHEVLPNNSYPLITSFRFPQASANRGDSLP